VRTAATARLYAAGAPLVPCGAGSQTHAGEIEQVIIRVGPAAAGLALRIERVVFIQPDHVKRIVNNDAVNSAMLIRSKRKLPARISPVMGVQMTEAIGATVSVQSCW